MSELAGPWTKLPTPKWYLDMALLTSKGQSKPVLIVVALGSVTAVASAGAIIYIQNGEQEAAKAKAAREAERLAYEQRVVKQQQAHAASMDQLRNQYKQQYEQEQARLPIETPTPRIAAAAAAPEPSTPPVVSTRSVPRPVLPPRQPASFSREPDIYIPSEVKTGAWVAARNYCLGVASGKTYVAAWNDAVRDVERRYKVTASPQINNMFAGQTRLEIQKECPQLLRYQ